MTAPAARPSACRDERIERLLRLEAAVAERGRAYSIRVGGYEGFQGSGVMTITADFITVQGDFNLDGSVGLSDLTILLANFGLAEGASYSQGDIDTDGDVDLSDLTQFLAHFGTTCQ